MLSTVIYINRTFLNYFFSVTKRDGYRDQIVSMSVIKTKSLDINLYYILLPTPTSFLNGGVLWHFLNKYKRNVSIEA